MIPATFTYCRPATVTDAITAFGADDGGCFLAGGQSLVPMMNARQIAPKKIIDINAIAELRQLSYEGDQLHIGALVRHSALCDSREIVRLGAPRRLAEFLAAAGRSIGNLAIRNRGTIGGSVALGEHYAEWPLVMTLLGAEVMIAGVKGRRQCAYADFQRTGGGHALAPGEIVTGIVLGPVSAGTRYGFSQAVLRHECTRSTAAARLRTVGGRRVLSSALSGFDMAPTKLPDIDVSLDGDEKSNATFFENLPSLVFRSFFETGLYPEDPFASQVAGSVTIKAISQALNDVSS